jgi:hypothetical protein
MHELVMHWRRRDIRVLPYLDDFMFMERGFWQCVRMARRVEKDLFLAGLKINVPKCHRIPAQQRRQLGFDVDFATGESRFPENRREALMASVGRALFAHKGRVVARSLASITETVLPMHLSWVPVT